MMEFITFNDGNRIPAVGLGVFKVPNDAATEDAVSIATSSGIKKRD